MVEDLLGVPYSGGERESIHVQEATLGGPGGSLNPRSFSPVSRAYTIMLKGLDDEWSSVLLFERLGCRLKLKKHVDSYRYAEVILSASADNIIQDWFRLLECWLHSR